MTGQIKINGKDIWLNYKAQPLKGTYDTLQGSWETKEVVSNESRLENGVRLVINSDSIKAQKREFSLTFLLEGSTYSEIQANTDLMLGVLRSGMINFEALRIGQTFKLLFRKVEEIKDYRRENFRTLKIKFLEPNPTDR
nr:MAG TPA: hypothetical protein [Caudoviricetes sp.]